MMHASGAQQRVIDARAMLYFIFARYLH